MSPPSTPEEPLAPGEIRCGIDDGPVPIGAHDDDLRRPSAALRPELGDPFAAPSPLEGDRGFVGMMIENGDVVPLVGAAKASATLKWSLGDGLVTAPAFEERAHACGEEAEPIDGGEVAFSVRVAASGGPLSVKPTGTKKPSIFTNCLATALCSLGLQSQGAVGRRLEVSFDTRITPPVYLGDVLISIVGERGAAVERTASPRDLGGLRITRRRSPPPTLTAADHAYIAKTIDDAHDGALACARNTPPNGELGVSTGPMKASPRPSPYQKIDVAMPPPQPPQQRAAADYQSQMSACFQRAVQAVLTTPPKSFSPTGKVFASASYTPRSPSALPPTR